MRTLRKLSKRMITQQRFNLEKITNNQETPKLNLFTNGQWTESSGSHERIPHPLDKRITIAEVPILDLAEERLRVKENMQKVSTQTK